MWSVELAGEDDLGVVGTGCVLVDTVLAWDPSGVRTCCVSSDTLLGRPEGGVWMGAGYGCGRHFPRNGILAHLTWGLLDELIC